MFFSKCVLNVDLIQKNVPCFCRIVLMCIPRVLCTYEEAMTYKALSENVWPGMLLKRHWKSAADGIVLQNFDSERESMEGNKSSSWYLALLRTCSEFSLPSGKQVVVTELKQRH